MFEKFDKKGFTLVELLIVVAIVAVLVAISIPILFAQLEKAREATDAANIRSAYAEVVTAAMTENPTNNVTRTVKLTQTQDGWQGSVPRIAGDGLITGTGHIGVTVVGEPDVPGNCVVTYVLPSGTSSDPSVTIEFKPI